MESEIVQEVVEQLKISEKLRGPLEPVVLGADGHLVDGHQRKAADPDWPEIVNPKLKTEEDCVLFEIDKNWHRTNKDENWKRKRIERLARFGNTVLDVIRKTGLPDTTVYRYYPSDLKDQVKANAGRLGGEAKSATSVEAISQDIINQSEESARSAIVECANCHLGYRFDELKIVDEKLYCHRCAGAAHVAFENEKKRLEREAATKPVSPKSLDTWEQKKANMSPHDSQFQQEVFVELASEGLTFETNVKLPVVETEPDGLRRDVNLLVYLDNVEIHKGKRSDKDEQIRELFKKHHPEVIILGIPFTGKSEKEKARVKQLIREKYELLKGETAKFDVPTTGQGEIVEEF